MQQIANILFDFGNVIIDIDQDGAKERLVALMDHGYNEQELLAHVEQLIKHYETDTITTEAFVSGLARYVKKGVSREQIVDAWNSMLIGIPSYRFGMLLELKSRYTTLLLSNTNALHMEWVYRHLREVHGIDRFEKNYFHGHYYSFLIGKRKPDTDYFRYVIDDALISPDRSLFIDDIEENINSAKALGFQTIHIHTDEEIAEILKLRGLY
jgi:putative hydrolase of the HAD superfamily